MFLRAKALYLLHHVLELVAALETHRPTTGLSLEYAASFQGEGFPSINILGQVKQEVHKRAPEDDPQTSLTLDPSQIQTAYASQGLDESDPNITPSLTSTNNFINFCMTQNINMINGEQVRHGSCCPTPMGRIVAKDRMPSCKFIYPKNGALLFANTTFTVKLAIRNLEAGLYANPDFSFYSAPQTTNESGILRGHSHIVIEAIPDYMSDEPLDASRFTFFKATKKAAVDGILTPIITGGVPAGLYRMSTITTAINRQPALVAIAQHGSLEDVIYFRVIDNYF